MKQIPLLLPGSRYLKAKQTWKLGNSGNLILVHMDANGAFDKLQGQDLSHADLMNTNLNCTNLTGALNM